jgi:putative transposase
MFGQYLSGTSEDDLSDPDLGEMVDSKESGSSLWQVIQWFKTMSTNEYIRGVKTLNWKRFNRKLWEVNYYEHIIKNRESLQRIINYIKNNPANWKRDKFSNDD